MHTELTHNSTFQGHAVHETSRVGRVGGSAAFREDRNPEHSPPAHSAHHSTPNRQAGAYFYSLIPGSLKQVEQPGASSPSSLAAPLVDSSYFTKLME